MIAIDPIVQEVGTGGAVFLASLGLLLKYKPWERSSSSSNGSSGAKSVDFWKVEIRKSIEEGIRVTMLPILSNQTDILRELKTLQQRSQEAITRLVTLAESRERRGD